MGHRTRRSRAAESAGAVRDARIVVLPGDGIGPEVTVAATRVLAGVAERFGHRFTFAHYPIGAAGVSAADVPLPPATREACLQADAVLLGAVGDPRLDGEPPERRPERGLLDLRAALGTFANLRPARAWPGLAAYSPVRPEILGGTDFLLVRELTGGLYYGTPRRREPSEGLNTLRYTRTEIERVAHVAFQQARRRRRHVTSVDKANVLEVSQLWRATAEEVARGYPDVTLEHLYVDTCAMEIVRRPTQFDVILTENLFGDILSDEAGAVVGSLGLLPSASLGERAGLFEPVHGSAPALAAQDVANPFGAILSAALLLRHGLNLEAEATAVEAACGAALRDGHCPADLGGRARCTEVTAAVLRHLERPRIPGTSV